MCKTLDLTNFFSTLNINPNDKDKSVIEKLTTLPKINREFICEQLAQFNSSVVKGNKNYKLEFSLEKDYVQVILKDPVLYATNPSDGILPVAFQFYLYQLKVDHEIGCRI